MNSTSSKSLLLLSESTVESLLKCYDYPHPEKRDEIIEGYDKNHVLRTAKMCTALAIHLGHDEKFVNSKLHVFFMTSVELGVIKNYLAKYGHGQKLMKYQHVL